MRQALLLGAVIILLATGVPRPGWAVEGCAETGKDLKIGSDPPDLLIDSTCKLTGDKWYYGTVNIVAGGKLIFVEPATESQVTSQEFWAKSIIIENGGQLLAGVDVPTADMASVKPYGSNGKTLTLHLYGPDPRGADPTKDEGPGVSCSTNKDPSKFADCGIPLTGSTPAGETANLWDSNGASLLKLPGGVNDYFYKYGYLHGDSGTDPVTQQPGHFGYKVLALSYGGTLQLRGLKGTTLTSRGDIDVMLKEPEQLTAAEEGIVTNSGADWGRLAKFNKSGSLTLDRNVVDDWRKDDEIVVTPTDYFPDHYEVRKLSGAPTPSSTVAGGTDLTVGPAFANDHSDKQYDIGTKIGDTSTAFRTAFETVDGANPPFLGKAETRAAVALLTRSIRVVSEGNLPNEPFGAANTYGGHVVFRAGFEKLQIQGVEFKQLGQGGLLGRYPVHFHVARRVPADTYIIDSSVNESMTRWYVLHSTLGVTLARNVGFKSIGHGYFLEDATETDNKFYSNIGIDARAAVVSDDNPKRIPGLLEAANYSNGRPLKYNSDSAYPTAFWITNGWNALAGNMAAGAGTCGACYWYVSAANHDMIETGMNNSSMKWSGYSAIQADPAGPTVAVPSRAGLTPVRLFYKNYCSTAEHALSITDGSPCTSVANGHIARIENPRNARLLLPDGGDETKESMDSRMYFPRYGGNRNSTVCNDPSGCQTTPPCAFGNPVDCAPSVFSHLTSQFNWAQTNFSAIWLRSGFLLLDHNFLSDIQGPGVTFVSGGDYRRSNLPIGYWGIVSNSIFVGHTQTDPFASDVGNQTLPCTFDGNGCLYTKAGVAYPLAGFGAGERMYNVYDGPAYEDTNAYLDINPLPCTSIETCMYFNTLGVRKAQTTFGGLTQGQGYLPNAAIGWKQSNGFYYPPAFRSQNLFFKDVDIRHYVVEPLTFPGTYRTNVPLVEQQYIGANPAFFRNWSDVDRQTELSDDDGALTGFTQTISVNEDPFFRAPSQTAQCRSNVGVGPANACAGQTPPNPVTARTSPYDHITTALYSRDDRGGPATKWADDCMNENCTGVPIYRQYLTGIKGTNAETSTREWTTWMKNGCDAQYRNLFGKARPLQTFDRYQFPQGPNPPPLNEFEKFDAQCPSPFVRMAGMAFGQRSVLTVNNGKYFIDTTQSENFQRNTKDLEPGTRFISLFQPGKTYYVYFLFAKKNTKQIYQIYGGPDFTPSMVTGVRVNINSWTDAGSFTPWSSFPWKVTPAVKVDPDDPDPTGVVNVEVDFSNIDPSEGNLDPTKVSSGDTCQPRTYCKVSNDKCGCDESKLGALASLSPNYKNVCKNVCEHWAVQDIDCPKEGCFGFQFTLPSQGFVADDALHRPKPSAYPIAGPWQTIKLQQTSTKPDDKNGNGDCSYTDTVVPSDSNPTCKVAD